MNDLRKAAQQALEALELEATSPPIDTTAAAMDALRGALAEPPTNQCGETCERAKLCAVCAGELAEQVPLDPDIAKIVNDNLWNLYVEDPAEPVSESSDTTFDRWWDDALDGPTPIAPVSKETAQWIWNEAKAESAQVPHLNQIRSDFEQRMIGVGASPTALSRLNSGEYLSPSIQAAWDAEKKKYTGPPQRKSLTDEEINDITDEHWPDFVAFTRANLKLARAIERAHGIGVKE